MYFNDQPSYYNRPPSHGQRDPSCEISQRWSVPKHGTTHCCASSRCTLPSRSSCMLRMQRKLDIASLSDERPHCPGVCLDHLLHTRISCVQYMQYLAHSSACRVLGDFRRRCTTCCKHVEAYRCYKLSCMSWIILSSFSLLTLSLSSHSQDKQQLQHHEVAPAEETLYQVCLQPVVFNTSTSDTVYFLNLL